MIIARDGDDCVITSARRLLGLAVVGLGAVPGVVLGWLSTVTVVTWWALGLGLGAAVVYWTLPDHSDDASPDDPVPPSPAGS